MAMNNINKHKGKVPKMMFSSVSPSPEPGSIKNMKYAKRLVLTGDGLGIVVKRALLTS